MEHKTLSAGFGGQGVMIMGRLIARTGMNEDKRVLWFPSYGSEVRGGTANCSVIVSDSEIETPVFYEADSIIVMNGPSLNKFKDQVKSDGNLLLNSSLVKEEVGRDDINIFRVPVNDIAEDLGNIKVANLVMLGAYTEVTKIISEQTTSEILPDVFPEKYHDMLGINREALKKGKEYIRENY